MTLPEPDYRLIYGPERGPLADYQIEELAGYNQRRSKGIVHDPEYMARMAVLQERWQEWAATQVGTLSSQHRSWLRRWFG